MKNIVKTSIYGGLGFALVMITSVANAINFSQTATTTNIGGDDEITAELDGILGNLFGILYFVAILYGLFGGFNILTAAGDDEKVSKGKTIIIHALLGLLVIFIASSVVTWFVGALV